jgi:hypothetical protein
MHSDFSDLIALSKEPPKWWDAGGVPRFCDFHPMHIASFYAHEAALILIECQNCGHEFQVCVAQDGSDLATYSVLGHEPVRLSENIQGLHYGDPPNIGCCMSGPSMNSVPRRVLQFWQHGPHTNYEWKRVPELEVPIDPDWAKE